MAVFRFIESWYNPRRLHSALGYESPVNFRSEALGGGVNTSGLQAAVVLPTLADLSLLPLLCAFGAEEASDSIGGGGQKKNSNTYLSTVSGEVQADPSPGLTHGRHSTALPGLLDHVGRTDPGRGSRAYSWLQVDRVGRLGRVAGSRSGPNPGRRAANSAGCCSLPATHSLWTLGRSRRGVAFPGTRPRGGRRSGDHLTGSARGNGQCSGLEGRARSVAPDAFPRRPCERRLARSLSPHRGSNGGERADAPPNKRLLQSRQPSTSHATLAITTLAAQQNRRSVRAQISGYVLWPSHFTESRTARGCFAATLNKILAGPWGWRRPCSQF